MRRLAVQSRNDGYASVRDYQELHEKIAHRFAVNSEQNRIVFTKDIEPPAGVANFIGFGGFVCTARSTCLTVTIEINGFLETKNFNIGNAWSRVGFAIPVNFRGAVRSTVIIEWSGSPLLDIWGFNVDFVELPEKIAMQNPTADILNSSHICPETFYLDHGNALNLDVDAEQSTPFDFLHGSVIHVKKCSFCQRYLPVNPMLLGALSFHKHNAKKTFHQNECRSCKKWRINDDFNPIRTTDQLHESSVITRERKILLREPLILQEIKERTGAGLKSQVWERFGRRCFYCGIEVKLDEFQLDHTRPLSYLWPIDEHATCLCPEHNNLKKDKFPVEFYTHDQLIQLSRIVGLSYAELSSKSVNLIELQRIIDDIVEFAMEWDARTFAAISRKINELMPATNLFEILRLTNASVFEELVAELQDRPDAIY
jgi:hypothetical protein